MLVCINKLLLAVGADYTSISEFEILTSVDEWRCNTCMLSNPSDKTTCVACQSAKPASATAKKSTADVTGKTVLTIIYTRMCKDVVRPETLYTTNLFIHCSSVAICLTNTKHSHTTIVGVTYISVNLQG